MAHEIVEKWVDACGEEVQDPGGQVQNVEGAVEELRVDARHRAVNSHQTLGMERRPAKEECHSDGNCKYIAQSVFLKCS